MILKNQIKVKGKKEADKKIKGGMGKKLLKAESDQLQIPPKNVTQSSLLGGEKG